MGTTSASVCRADLQLSPGPPLPQSTEHVPASSTSQSHTPFVKSCKSLLRFLLVATHDCHETDFQGALHDRWSQQNETACELVYFDLGRKLDFLRSHFSLSTFELGFLPGAARQHMVQSPPQQRRSRKHPLGLCSLSPQSQATVDQSNREVEIVTWLLEQATLCVNKTIGILLIFPEDLGGHEHSGPATSRSFHKPRVGEITVDRQLCYDGPLHAKCSCSTRHARMRGTGGQEAFNSSIVAGFSNNFGSLARPLLLRTKDMCPSGLEDFPARVLSTLRPSLLASHPFHSSAGLVLLSHCTTCWQWSTFSQFPCRLCRCLVGSGVLRTLDGGTAIILVSAASMLRSWLVQTWMWRGQVRLHRLLIL